MSGIVSGQVYQNYCVCSAHVKLQKCSSTTQLRHLIVEM